MVNSKGLSSAEAARRLSEKGPNQIFKASKISFFGIARHEVTEPMILLLLIVGFFYSIWGKLEDSLTIFVVIFLLVFAEVYNEYRAKKAISALEKIAAPKTKVLRDGVITEVDSEQVVPGDTLVLITGTKIAADAKLKNSVGVQIDQSILTGESFPQEKKDGDDVFAGTIVVAGEGEAEVLETGKATRLGEIAQSAKEVRAPRTTLQLAMKSLSGKLVYVAVFFSVVIPLIGVLRGQNLRTMILTGLSLSFATIPEELPIIITMVLGLGAYTLSKHNFLVKRIKAAETLGNATVIVTDKTGTITENKMRIVSVYPASTPEVINKAFFSLTNLSISPLDKTIKERAGNIPAGDIVRQRNIGDSRKTRAVLRKAAGAFELFVSGAPEEVFLKCAAVPQDARSSLSSETMNGRRVIAIAYKKVEASQKDLDFDQIEKDMELVGLIGFEDPPRKEIKETIQKAKVAGVRTIMVTGDHPFTAKFIAKQVGILVGNQVLTGEDVDKMSDVDLQEAVKKITVFARTTPEHKYRIVKALQGNGEIVAVTGDGINDALALKGADIGIAMGQRGTDVAKDAAEVVLADDNFITIAQGIFEGRKFFDNLFKGIKYYLSVKTALIMIFLLPVLLGVPMPFTPIQIILLELFMDLAASAGFVSEPAEKNIYTRPPRNPREDMLGRGAIADIFIKGAALFAAVMIVYFFARLNNYGPQMVTTLSFSAWIFGHVILASISRSDKEPLFSLGVVSNIAINIWTIAAVLFLFAMIYVPFLSRNFNLVTVEPYALSLVALTAIVIIGLLELKKVILYFAKTNGRDA